MTVDGQTATVDFWGVTRRVRLDAVDEPVQPGDYILNHVGYAIARIPEEDIAATLALYDEMVRQSAGDLMRQDIEDELQATGKP